MEEAKGRPALKPWIAGRWPTPLRLCLSLAGACSAQVYNLRSGVGGELTAGTLVGDITAGLPPGDVHPGGFFLSEGSERESGLLADFHVHTDTGLILAARPLDRERTAVTPRGEIVQVEITVADVNDRVPRFPREFVRLSEAQSARQRFPLARLTGSRRGKIWHLGLLLTAAGSGRPCSPEEEGPFFQVRHGAPSDPLELLWLRRLDRDRAATHRLLVKAWDGGSPLRSGRLRVAVQMLDENDNAPTFGQREYRAHLREDAPSGTAVCRVFATDPDLGVNGEVSYVLSRRQGNSSAATHFELGERSGLLRLRRFRANHRLAGEARDGDAQPEVATALVAVEGLDANDNPPVIRLLYLPEAGASVSEGARSGDYIACVSVSDPDEQRGLARGVREAAWS